MSRKPRQRERHVELDLERRRREDHAAHARRVVVHPRRDDDGAHALRDDGDGLRREAVPRADVVDERLHVAHRRAEARRVTARAGRAAVPARIPGEEIEFGQVELGGQMPHAAGVLVAAVEDHDRAARRARRSPPSGDRRAARGRASRTCARWPFARRPANAASGGANRSFMARTRRSRGAAAHAEDDVAADQQRERRHQRRRRRRGARRRAPT